ncbi:cytochrome P450 [Lentzea sp. NPDC051213]|uniref:cytochrome P450 n=1 Tax=Lentzea sp. NPDC051213 TaxID=3364126 RepID=UPI003794CE83
MTTAGEQVHEFPMARTCPFAPPASYAEIREQRPIAPVRLPGGGQAWVVSRHEDVRVVLSDPRFSADRRQPGFPHLMPGGQVLPEEDAEPSMVSMDGAEHGQARRSVLSEFGFRRMEALRPSIQEIVDARIDALLAGPRPGDLVETVSVPVASLVICEILGVPYADRDVFQADPGKLARMSTPLEERRAANEAVCAYLSGLIADKEANPPDDLLGRQIIRLRDEGTYRREALAALAVLLLFAGYGTTANMISLGALALLRNPEQLAALAADPSRTPGAVEELLRYFTISDLSIQRLCVEDVTLGGQLIRAGEGVLPLTYAANRDPRVFDDPDALDIGRGKLTHLAFGYGPHQCLGSSLARLELQVVFDTLFRRVPGLALACAVDELPFKDGGMVYGLHRLPVTW